MPLFEVGIYNQTIRNYVRSGEVIPDHVTTSAVFQDVIYFDREATNTQVLNAKLEREFPPAEGFVIDYVKQTGE